MIDEKKINDNYFAIRPIENPILPNNDHFLVEKSRSRKNIFQKRKEILPAKYTFKLSPEFYLSLLSKYY